MQTQETHEALFKRYEDSEVTLSSERYAFWTVPTVLHVRTKTESAYHFNATSNLTVLCWLTTLLVN
ncbi:head to tail connecting protein [Vibrio phage vB_VpP_AC2]|uniref:Head to tail connecting protein n=1 Tax=Vibrio phage vB_VpP_AC2 TaxID=2961842 RepID=A0A9E7NLQ2_9CAUD|nr:head to tail connecting protein [Vibrio phage vB_VpP_AC2]UTQ72402.1 head to tail connecting protein [Vibrio phage vB_VpP_AC2]